MTITNHLYPIEGAISSLLSCLQHPSTLEETIFWLWELVYTLDNIEDGLLCIIALFYPNSSDSFLRFVKKRCESAALITALPAKATALSDIVCNLLKMPQDASAFAIHQIASDPTSLPHNIYLDPSGQSNTESCLKGACLHGDIHDIGFYLSREHTSSSTKTAGVISSLWDDVGSQNHLISRASQCARQMPNVLVKNSARFVSCPSKILTRISDIFQVIDSPDIRPYKKLCGSRKYKIRRHALTDTLITNKPIVPCADWLALAANGIAWQRRIANYGGVCVDLNVIFSSKDQEEAFYEIYNLEWDELSPAVRNLSLIH